MERIWCGCVCVWRWFDRLIEFLGAVYLLGAPCIWIAASLHAGHVVSFDEALLLAGRVLDSVMARWR